MTKKIKPSDAETNILNTLWDQQPCSVKAIHETLSKSRNVGYTTTLKQVQRMEDKGLVSREPGKGKSFNYRANVSEADTKSHLLDSFVATTFGDSVSELVMHALGNSETSEDEIKKIKQFINELESNG